MSFVRNQVAIPSTESSDRRPPTHREPIPLISRRRRLRAGHFDQSASVALTARAVASLRALICNETFTEPVGKFGLADRAGCDLFHDLHRLVDIEGEAMAVVGQE